MAAIVLTGSQIYVDDHDMTGDSNQAMMNANAEAKKCTVFSSVNWDTFIKGVKSADLDVSGFWTTGTGDTIDATEWAASGTAGRVVTFVPPGATEGGAAYMLQSVRTSYDFLGAHGEVAPFSLSAQGSAADGMVRGQLALTKTAGISSTGAIGSAVELGLVASDEYLYATFHVFPTVGTTITIEVESDTSGAFSTPTTRATIGPLTTVGGTWMTRVAGAIASDTFWRFNVTAVTGSFTAAGAIGIQ